MIKIIRNFAFFLVENFIPIITVDELVLVIYYSSISDFEMTFQTEVWHSPLQNFRFINGNDGLAKNDINLDINSFKYLRQPKSLK